MEETLGKRIISHRKRLGMTQDRLAEQLGVTAQAVSKWENDQAAPDTIKLIQLADLLDVDVEYLATGRVNQPKVVTTTQTVEKIVEKPVVTTVERIVEKPVVQFIDKPVVEIRKVYRKKYVRNVWEIALVGIVSFVLGILIGFLF